MSKRDAPADITNIFRRNKIKPKVFRTDRGGEYCVNTDESNGSIARLTDLYGFKHEKVSTGVSKYNGRAEKGTHTHTHSTNTQKK